MKERGNKSEDCFVAGVAVTRELEEGSIVKVSVPSLSTTAALSKDLRGGDIALNTLPRDDLLSQLFFLLLLLLSSTENRW